MTTNPYNFTFMPDLSINDWRKLASEDTSILGIVECDNFSPTSQYLVNDLRKLYQKTYTADQRIVILITKDYYLEQPAGLMLQAVNVWSIKLTYLIFL